MKKHPAIGIIWKVRSFSEKETGIIFINKTETSLDLYCVFSPASPTTLENEIIQAINDFGCLIDKKELFFHRRFIFLKTSLSGADILINLLNSSGRQLYADWIEE